jgi:ABC-type molybdenum transport system ATPase subunit/photorepair protein PhrA
VLAHVAQRGTALVLVSHHQEDILPFFTHRLLFEDGRIVEQGPIETLEKTAP